MPSQPSALAEQPDQQAPKATPNTGESTVVDQERIPSNPFQTSDHRPTLLPRTSNSSISSAGSASPSPSPSVSPKPAPLAQHPKTSPTGLPISPSRRLPPFVPSSPLSAASTRGRGRQSSTSSTISSATTSTEPTSLDEGEEYAMSDSGMLQDRDSGPASGSSSGSIPGGGGGFMNRPRGSSGADFYAVPSSSSQSLAPSHAISIPPSSGPLPISISTAIPPASVRLSTTPHFPSPLAQASGPEEDADHAKGDEEAMDDEEEISDRDMKLQPNIEREGSPLSREASAPVFGELDLSPTLSTVALPDSNSLGLEAASSWTPRALPRSSGHRRNLSGRDSSPEVDKTARAVRVRSVGRASQLGTNSTLAIGTSPSGTALARRRSRTSDAGLFPPTSPPGSPSTGSRGIPPIMGSTPPSPISMPANSISRHTSINLVSPPRTFAPSSPTMSRAPRSSLSAQLASPIPPPFPAPPPPMESIKLQKVPESVRSAMDFRTPTGSSYLGDAISLPTNQGIFGASTAEVKVPKTPAATRAPSPTSGSGSGSAANSEGGKSKSPSQSSSRVPSRGPSRRASQDLIPPVPPMPVALAAPVAPSSSSNFVPGHLSSASASSTSAFSPLFPFPIPSSPSMATTRTSRSKSVMQPSLEIPGTTSSSSSSSSPTMLKRVGHHDLGVSPLTTGISPLAMGLAGTPQQRAVSGTEGSTSRANARGVLSSHRTSIIPAGAESISGGNTDEYAQIILASRNAKMRKWKTSASSLGSLGLEAALSRVASEQQSGSRRKGIPSFGGEDEEDADAEGEDEVDAGNKEIEWVDWLDEYRKMKEAKLRAEQEATTILSTEAEESIDKGKGREFNPFEAATADVNTRRTTGFLTPDPPVNYFPLTATAASPTSATFQPKTTSLPTGGLPAASSSTSVLSRSNSKTDSTNVSPNQKRKKNFKLGTKIDAWWSAVRTSFSTGSEDERSAAGSSLGRRTSDTPMQISPPAPSRTSSQFARPSTPSQPILRNAASAQDLSQSRPRVPTGALAPAARVDGLLAPKPVSRPSSGSEESDAGTTKTDSRWRNPHLSLNLGPSFSALPQKAAQRLPPVTDSSDYSATTSSHFFSPPLPDSSVSAAPPSRAMKNPPSHPPIWDRTPALVQTSTALPSRGMPAMAKPQAIQEAKAGVNANFSMHTVREQIRLRLQTAKESCDKELKKIIHGITADVEVELHGAEGHAHVASGIPAGGFEEGRFGDLVGESDSPYGPYQSSELDSESEALADVDDAAHTDSDGATSRPPSRTRAESVRQSRPMVNRRPSMTTRRRVDSPRRQSLAPLGKRRTGASTDFSSYSMGDIARSGSGSATSSRSNSRSRSPLPPRKVSATSSPAHSSSTNLPLPQDSHSPLIVLLQDIITVATEILDTPISKLTARPGSCAEYIQRVQTIGQAWDDDPELASRRGWYVQLLLAVAGLSRVVEWWEAERGFWTFDDADEEDAEPILFVAKPGDDDAPEDVRSPGQSYPPVAAESEAKSSPTSQVTKYSPLGIDLGGGDAVEESRTFEDLPHTSPAVTEDAVKRHAEDLRQAVEKVRSQTLLMELSLDGQVFQFLSSAWEELVGISGDDCLDTAIADFLYPEDAAVFAEATRQLEADDSHTVEVSFRLRVASASETSQDDEPPEDLYEVMEGKGMLMSDGLSGGPSHTMWVVRPAPYAPEGSSAQLKDSGSGSMDHFHRRTASDPVMPFSSITRFSTEPILCRICERPTPAWFFEKHNETCNETHRLESDINECNDRLRDLVRTIDDISATLDSGDTTEGPDYRGIAFLLPKPASTPPTYLEGLRPPLGPKPSASFQLRKAQHRILDQTVDIVQTALTISTPTVLDETGDVPIQDQRLLSPNSENKLALVMRWQRPAAEEPALVRLLADTEEQIRFKLNSVNRLRNTILYAEKVRHEWEAKANHALASVAENHWESSSGSSFASPQLHPVPSKGSPRLLEPLELPRDPHQHLRRQSSHLFGLMSPVQGPDDLPGTFGSPGGLSMALSPRIPSGVPSSRTKASSIKDFAILKPISKGAFGSVYLVKKKTTGDYYAIKVLKKSDMIAKNQVTNVKAERMILMTQTESDFVVKLYYTFQSKDYLYLVMEYLNGGDCAALVKNMGELPEDWARKYIAEVVVGLEYLHASGIVHRDLKPDNLLIDAKGHLKLTDFGLSRIGLLGRQTRMPVGREQRRHFDSSSRSESKDPDLSNTSSPSSTPANAIGASQVSYFGSVAVNDNFWLDTPNSESSGSASVSTSNKNIIAGATEKLATSVSQVSDLAGISRPVTTARTFVGTPDYLAPESILGIGMDAGVDWWALGVICYEFLYGFPPFHDETPEKVFENILSRKIEWHEDAIDISPDARDFMERLLCSNASRRLGKGGAEEVKAHPFLEGIDWANLLKGEVDFVPKISDPESTDYFDPRGATDGVFADEDGHEDHTAERRPSPPPIASGRPHSSSDPLVPEDLPRRAPRERSETEPSPHEDFGTFNFRNLPVLKQANDDVIRQMREQMLPPPSLAPNQRLGEHSKSRQGSTDFRHLPTVPSLPSSPSATSSSSVPSRPTAPSTPYSLASSHSRRPSEQHAAVDRLKNRQTSLGAAPPGAEHTRRNSLPSRLRRASLSEYERPPIPEGWANRQERRRTSAASSLSSPAEGTEPLPPLKIPEHPPLTETMSAPPLVIPPRSDDALSAPRPRTIDCLVAGRNPISNKVLETMLVRLGTRVVVVPNGAEAILAAQGVKFDVIWMDLQMPVVDGEKAARMIKSTNNPSSDCYIVAVTSYSTGIDEEVGTLFSAVLPKPILRDQLLSVFKKLGFQQQTRRGSADRRGSEDVLSNAGEARRDSGPSLEV